MIPTKEQIESLPYLIVEELKENCSVSGVFSPGDDVPMAATRLPHILKVHAISCGYTGAYLGKDQGRNPHYTVPKEDFEKLIRSRCLDNKIPLKIYASAKVLHVSDILTVFNFDHKDKADDTGDSSANPGDTSADSILDNKDKAHDPGDTSANSTALKEPSKLSTTKLTNLLHELEFEDLVKEEKTDKAKNCDKIRGPVQRHFGFGSNYSLTRLPEDEGGYVYPRVLGGEVTEAWSNRFNTMTKIADHIYNQEGGEAIKGNPDFELYGDEERNDRFSKTATHPNSKLEALTWSQTTFPGGLLKVHMDVNNDDTPEGRHYNYNYVVCAWVHRLDDDGKVVRDAILGYSRRCIPDFLRRTSICKNYVTGPLCAWKEKLPEWRKCLRPTSDIFDINYFGGLAKYSDTGALLFPPTFNKQATYLSAFADSFLQFKEAYERNSKKVMTVERQLECVLPVAFCNSARPYTRVLRDWRTHIPSLDVLKTKNMSLHFIHHSNDHYVSFRKGGHPRHQPTRNTDPSSEWILTALRRLRHVVIKAKKTSYTYKCMNKDLTAIKGIGELTSQHLIHMLCLVGLVHPRYGAEASICRGNRTAKRISENYGVPQSSFNCLLEHIAEEMECTKAQGENINCKFLQPDNTQFRDSIESDQRVVMWVDILNGVPVLRCTYRIKGKNKNKSIIPFNEVLCFEVTPNANPLLVDINTALHQWYAPYDSKLLVAWSKNAMKVSTKRKRGSNSSPSVSDKRQKTGPTTFLPVPIYHIDWKNIDNKATKDHIQGVQP